MKFCCHNNRLETQPFYSKTLQDIERIQVCRIYTGSEGKRFQVRGFYYDFDEIVTHTIHQPRPCVVQQLFVYVLIRTKTFMTETPWKFWKSDRPTETSVTFDVHFRSLWSRTLRSGDPPPNSLYVVLGSIPEPLSVVTSLSFFHPFIRLPLDFSLLGLS